MDTILLVITVMSLALALTMSLVAWKVLRADRIRATARMDALRAMALASTQDDPASDLVELGVRDSTELDVADEDPDNLQDFAAADEPWDVLQPPPDGSYRGGPVHAGQDALFDAPSADGVAGRRWLALAAVALLMAAGVATVSALNSPEITAAVAASRAGSSPSGAAATHPLELVALHHAIDAADGSFHVTGLIQNPPNGVPQTGLTAVVYLFTDGDQYTATGRTTLNDGELAVGGESSFVVKIPGVTAVRRYRVGFRAPDGTSIPHVDRRGEFLRGTTEALAGADMATDSRRVPAATEEPAR